MKFPHPFSQGSPLGFTLLFRAILIATCTIIFPNTTLAGDKIPPHPRLLLSEARLEEIRKESKSDPLMSDILEYTRNVADKLLDAPVVDINDPKQDGLNQCRAVLGRIFVGAFQYRLTGDKRYAELAKREMLKTASSPDWHPKHFLDTSEIGLGMAVGYDWLYSYLTPDERKVLETAMVEKALQFAPAIYSEKGNGLRGNWTAFGKADTTSNNWNQVCNGGLLALALSLYDERPDLANIVLEGVPRSLPLAMQHYVPDGVGPEGPIYWAYGMTYHTLILAMLKDNFGTDYELTKLPGFKETPSYYLQVYGPSGIAFNYADAGPARFDGNTGSNYAYSWMGQYFDRPEIIADARARLEAHVKAPMEPYSAQFTYGSQFKELIPKIIWLPKKASNPPTPPLDAHFRGLVELVFFRSSWNDKNALWFAFKGGSNDAPHGHLDLGTFVLDANGVRWGVDLGADKYSQPGYWDRKVGGKRWNYFRLNNHSHNTTTPGDALQNAIAKAPIVSYESSPKKSFAICDLSAAYPESVKSLKRGVAMLDRSRILIQDEAKGLPPGTPLRWRMLTASTVEISPDGHTATLTQDNQKLNLEILSPSSSKFTSTPATPPTPSERENPGISILEILSPSNSGSSSITVLASPLGNFWKPLPAPSIIPLDQWKL